MKLFQRLANLKYSHPVDAFTFRGIIYSFLGSLGLGYELFFVQPPRLFLLIMYSFVIGVGLICIFFIKERQEQTD